jgi:hypothetical protein
MGAGLGRGCADGGGGISEIQQHLRLVAGPAAARCVYMWGWAFVCVCVYGGGVLCGFVWVCGCVGV